MLSRRSILFLLSAASLPAAPAPETLAGGPYVVNVGPRSATVMWLVQGPEARLGTAPDRLSSAVPVLRSEKVSFTNLKPGTTYYYDVLGQEAGKGSFKTAPAGPAAFRFIVYGDTRTRHEMHQRIVDAMVRAEPDFVVHTGDLVADGSNTTDWPRFFAIERELLRKAAFFPVLGNHERNNPQYYRFFDVTRPYYSFDWGSAHFSMLNTDAALSAAMEGRAKSDYWNEQVRWLEQDLEKAQKADLRFVVFHHPPFTAVKKRQASGADVRELVPLLEKYRVAAVFSGHDHNYQRHEKNGIQYIVTGGGGAPLYPVDGPIPGLTRKVVSTEHYVIVKVDGKMARIEAVALDGSIIEAMDLR